LQDLNPAWPLVGHYNRPFSEWRVIGPDQAYFPRSAVFRPFHEETLLKPGRCARGIPTSQRDGQAFSYNPKSMEDLNALPTSRLA